VKLLSIGGQAEREKCESGERGGVHVGGDNAVRSTCMMPVRAATTRAGLR
jgi:hypothetical protein